jgi:hypothetical protein
MLRQIDRQSCRINANRQIDRNLYPHTGSLVATPQTHTDAAQTHRYRHRHRQIPPHTHTHTHACVRTHTHTRAGSRLVRETGGGVRAVGVQGKEPLRIQQGCAGVGCAGVVQHAAVRPRAVTLRNARCSPNLPLQPIQFLTLRARPARAHRLRVRLLAHVACVRACVWCTCMCHGACV